MLLSFLQTENQNAYYAIALFLFLYALHTLVTLQNRNYIVILLLFISLLVYKVYQDYEKRENNVVKTKENFIKDTIQNTKEKDNKNAYKYRNYKRAKALLKSDTNLRTILQKFKSSLGKYEQESYQNVLTLIVRFFEDYGRYLLSEHVLYKDKIIEDMLVRRQEIMNAIEELRLQVIHNPINKKQGAQLSLICLASLDRCIRVLRNKWKMFHYTAPYPINITGNEHQLY